jgi:IS4 transposase
MFKKPKSAKYDWIDYFLVIHKAIRDNKLSGVNGSSETLDETKSVNGTPPKFVWRHYKRYASGRKRIKLIQRYVPRGRTVHCKIKRMYKDRTRLYRIHEALTAKLLRKLAGKTVAIAFDTHDQDFYGKLIHRDVPNTCITRAIGEGTNKVYRYCVARLIVLMEQFIAILPRLVMPHEKVEDYVDYVFRYLRRLRINLNMAFMDRAFDNIEVMKKCDRYHVQYLIPVSARGEKLKKIIHSHKTHVHQETYTKKRGKYNFKHTLIVAVPDILLHPDRKPQPEPQQSSSGTKRRGRSKKEQEEKDPQAFFTSIPLPRNYVEEKDPKKKQQLLDEFGVGLSKMYRERFGVESTNRDTKNFRAKTFSIDPTIRLFNFVLSTALYNVWMQARSAIRDKKLRKKFTQQKFLDLYLSARILFPDRWN